MSQEHTQTPPACSCLLQALDRLTKDTVYQ